jgi:hypothetical protein
MSEENKTRAWRAGEITCPDDPDLIEEVCAPDLLWHEPDQDFRGIEEGKRYVSDAPASPPLDTLAKTLADGTISRKQALKLMGAGTAAVASLALAGCGGKDQAKEGASGSGEPSGGSTNNTTVAQNGSTPEQGSDAEEVAAVAKRAMEKYHLKTRSLPRLLPGGQRREGEKRRGCYQDPQRGQQHGCHPAARRLEPRRERWLATTSPKGETE